MAKYTIQYLPRMLKDAVILEMDRERLTRQEFSTIIATLFDTVCQGCEYDTMYIPVWRGNKLVFSLAAEVYVDGCNIDCYVSINGRFYRRMNIAS